LQYLTPEFDKIKDEHFKPAFQYGLQQQLFEIQQITDNQEAATFENTIVAIENSGEVLKRAQAVFFNFTSANTNPELQKLEEEFAPLFAAQADLIYLNDALYQRVKGIDINALTGEDKRLAEYYLQQFEIAGAALSADKKEELK